MKKLLLSMVAIAGLAFTTQAQTEKGNILLGGNVGFNSSKIDGANKSDVNFSIMPTIGYFVSDNIALGTGVGYSYDKKVSNKNLNQAFEVSPFGRYYVGLSDQFKFFGQLSVPMAFGNNKLVNDQGEVADDQYQSTTNIGINLAPGLAFYPTKKIGIELSVNGLGYDHFTSKEELTGNKATYNSFGFNADTFAPKLGVMFHF